MIFEITIVEGDKMTVNDQARAAQVEWLCRNLRESDKKLISVALSAHKAARETLLILNLGSVAKSNTRRLIKAIESGECDAQQYPDFRTQNKRSVFAKLMINRLGYDRK